MSPLRIYLFGKFHVRTDEQALESFDAYKALELFCYLLLHRDRSHPRETLAGVLWGDYSIDQSKKYLRQSLWQLQAALDPFTASTNVPILLVDPDWVQFNTGLDYWLDVAVFEQAYDRVQNVPGYELSHQEVNILEQTVDFYKGDLLHGWYQDWCQYERDRFRNMYLAMLDKLMAYCEAYQQYETGVAYGARILRYDPAHERAHQRMMRMQYLAGDRTAALRQFEHCRISLGKELDVGPSKSTLELYEQIRVDRLPDSSQSIARTTAQYATVATNASLHSTLSWLRELQTALVDIQRQVQMNIETIELTISIRPDKP